MKEIRRAHYYKVPLWVGYKLSPNLSLGGGVQWNRFESAVTHNVVTYTGSLNRSRDLVMQSVSDTYEPSNSESIRRTFYSGLLQAGYHYNRMRFVTRIDIGFQPALQLAEPGSFGQRNVRSRSLELIFQYNLFE